MRHFLLFILSVVLLSACTPPSARSKRNEIRQSVQEKVSNVTVDKMTVNRLVVGQGGYQVVKNVDNNGVTSLDTVFLPTNSVQSKTPEGDTILPEAVETLPLYGTISKIDDRLIDIVVLKDGEYQSVELKSKVSSTKKRKLAEPEYDTYKGRRLRVYRHPTFEEAYSQAKADGQRQFWWGATVYNVKDR
jgi:uncharacterized protein YceK